MRSSRSTVPPFPVPCSAVPVPVRSVTIPIEQLCECRFWKQGKAGFDENYHGATWLVWIKRMPYSGVTAYFERSTVVWSSFPGKVVAGLEVDWKWNLGRGICERGRSNQRVWITSQLSKLFNVLLFTRRHTYRWAIRRPGNIQQNEESVKGTMLYGIPNWSSYQ